MSALRGEPTLSGGVLKDPACSQHAAASLTQDSPFPWKMRLKKNEEKFSSLPFPFLTRGGTNEDWYVFLLVFQFKYAVMHLMRKGSLHPPCFLYRTFPSPHHFAIAGVTSAEIWGQGRAAVGAPLALWGHVRADCHQEAPSSFSSHPHPKASYEVYFWGTFLWFFGGLIFFFWQINAFFSHWKCKVKHMWVWLMFRIAMVSFPSFHIILFGVDEGDPNISRNWFFSTRIPHNLQCFGSQL